MKTPIGKVRNCIAGSIACVMRIVTDAISIPKELKIDQEEFQDGCKQD